ncbi:MAG: cupin domain-containing protein [Methylococcaceae bacterium]|nr:MAG: cupin domain-containing protein [Methylococcaceae bacterium]
MFTHYRDIAAYQTKDGSEIRELMHPAQHGNQRQSLAEASLPPGGVTLPHRHRLSEELYHITHGCGRVTVGDREWDVAPGDTVCIAPGTPHCIVNTGSETLRLLCCCAPAYAHEDTEVLAGGVGF